MSIQVLFFGATATISGKRSIQVDVGEDPVASAVFERVLTDHPRLRAHKLHFSVNQQYANGDEPLSDGDELAIFTAVSGG